MTSLIQAFNPPSRTGDAWFNAGPASSYPSIDSSMRVAEQRPCSNGKGYTPGCRIFHVPCDDSSKTKEVAVDEWKNADVGDIKDQVMVFRYGEGFVAVNHECPHSSYPLSNGTPFDIEDFGVVLSSGITCPKHNWSFDLHTGTSDHGGYKLKVWEVELRPGAGEGDKKDVWVRRKQRIGKCLH